MRKRGGEGKKRRRDLEVGKGRHIIPFVKLTLLMDLELKLFTKSFFCSNRNHITYMLQT